MSTVRRGRRRLFTGWKMLQILKRTWAEGQYHKRQRRTTKKEHGSAAQGETTAGRRDGAQQGDCQRSKRRVQQTPENELLTGTLEHRRPPQYRPSRIVRHERGDLGKEHKEKTDEQRSPQRRNMLRGAKLSVGLPSTRGEQRFFFCSML